MATVLNFPTGAGQSAVTSYGGGGGGGISGGSGDGSGGGMTEAVTREELKDKLATAEAKTDAKFERVTGSLSLITDRLTTIGADVSAIRHDNKNTRLTVVVTAIASVLAIIGVLLTAQADLLSAFQTGLTAVGTVASNPPQAANSSPQPQQGTGAGTQP